MFLKSIIIQGINKRNKVITIQGQTVHWIGAQVCVCLFLDSRDKSVNLKILSKRPKKKKEQNNNKWSVLVAEPAQNANFRLVVEDTGNQMLYTMRRLLHFFEARYRLFNLRIKRAFAKLFFTIFCLFCSSWF